MPVTASTLVDWAPARGLDPRLAEPEGRGPPATLTVRVGVHRGLVYLDTAEDDVYGLAANLAARVSGLAPPNTVVFSEAVAPLVHDDVELKARPPPPGRVLRG